jgi:hypothetical protein
VLLKEIGADPPALFEIPLLLIKQEAIQLKEGEQQRTATLLTFNPNALSPFFTDV